MAKKERFALKMADGTSKLIPDIKSVQKARIPKKAVEELKNFIDSGFTD